MNEPTNETLARRLNRVEREMRWWRVFGSAAVVLGFTALLIGATYSKIADEVRAKRFVLADDKGKSMHN